MFLRAQGRERGNSHLFRNPAGTRNQFGQAEIQYLGLSTPGDENIGRLEIAMDDSTLMGGVEGVGNLNGDVKNLSARQRLARDDVLESQAFQELHRNEGVAFGFVDLVNGADVGMIEGRGGPCLALKSLQDLMVADKVGWEEFQCYVPTKPEILGAIYDPHAPTAQMFLDAVVGDDFANHTRPTTGPHVRMLILASQR